MQQETPSPFQQIPASIRGHFSLNLYAAIDFLFLYIQWLGNFGGTTLDALMIRYPFLTHYQAQIQAQKPAELSALASINWWQAQILDWEVGCPLNLPLKSLTEHCQFSFNKRMALVLCGLVEEDSRFGTLLTELQAPLAHRHFSLELLSNILSCHSQTGMNDRVDVAEECQNLLAEGFLNCPNTEAAQSEWLLRVPVEIWETVRSGLKQQPIKGCEFHPALSLLPVDKLIYHDDFLLRIKRLAPLIASGQNKTVIIRSDPGSDPVEVLGAVAKELQQGLLLVSQEASRDEACLSLLEPLAAMGCAMPVLTYELAPGETANIPSFSAWTGAVGLCLGSTGGLSGDTLKKSITLTLPALDRALRLHHWQQSLGYKNTTVETIADSFFVSGKYIRQTAELASSLASFEGYETVDLSHVREASRSLNRQTLENLADHLETSGAWHNLICNGSTGSRLRELQQRCLYRERLLEHLGPAFKNNANRGVRALFTGVSGTGKTLAAKILAAETGMDLYRVDLAAVINKYIGETEKNLHKILSRAESLDIILLLDEGDSLLAGRTDVKSANDRYANLETNYLLQRLENYQGIILITTNLSENIDRAFQRRMDVVVPFYSPQAEERWAIMQQHLPDNHQITIEYLQQVAQQCTLTGGHIRNVVTNAALSALHSGQVIDDFHMQKALQAEYQKAGGIFPLQQSENVIPEEVDEMDDFVSALQQLRY